VLKRPTISDIAEHAGVSKGAVSFALNDRPGVSDRTRARIRASARALGWYPSSAARALSGARTGLVGLVIARNATLMAVEPYFMELISGIEADLGENEIGLVLHVVGEDPEREMEIYRRWAGQRRVDGVLLVDLRRGDPRVALCEQIGLPAITIGERMPGQSAPCLLVDPVAPMRQVVRHLADLGHRHIGRVAGVPAFQATARRGRAFRAEARRLGLTAVSVKTDYTAAQGDRATRRLLSQSPRPTALVYDNDVMAVSAVSVAHDLGLAVPADLSVVAWDDSPLCELTHPSITAVRLDVVGCGAAAARMLRELLDDEQTADVVFEPAVLVHRGSTGPAPAATAAFRRTDGRRSLIDAESSPGTH
jgi:DNA-binding LacI/PurR family transcriptional regulator